MTRLSFIIPWYMRLEIREALELNRAILEHSERETVVVNWGVDRSHLDSLLGDVSDLNVRIVDTSCVSQQGTMNKAQALNVGVYASRGNILLLLDADVLLRADDIARALEVLDDRTFIVFDRATERDPASSPQTLYRNPYKLREQRILTELTFADGKRAGYELWQGVHGRSIPGLIMLSRKSFLRVGGCNSQLTGWGFEDYDLQIRLQAAAGLERYIMGQPVHLTHAIRNGATLAESERKNMHCAFANYARGHYAGTFESDIAAWKEASRLP